MSHDDLVSMKWIEYNRTRSLYQMTFILQLLSFELGHVVIDVGK
jgi:hypothetical protein